MLCTQTNKTLGLTVIDGHPWTTAVTRLRAWDAFQTSLDTLQIALDVLQFSLDGLQIGKSILIARLHLVWGGSRLRAVRDDGTRGDDGALIGVPYRRSLHETDRVGEIGLAG